MSEGLHGKRALVTGGAAGIGLAAARMLAARGAQVAIIDRDQSALDAADGFAASACADVRDTLAIRAAIGGVIGRLGGLDILVNCAGVDLEAPTADMSDEAWERVLDINLTGTMRICRAAYPALAASGGAGGAAIVNLSSGAGLSPLPERAAYCSAKAGLVMFSKSLAMEWAKDGIRVNAICPGAVDTALFRTSYESHPDPDARLEQIRARYALGRIAGPDELAEAIVWLASPAASYVTGIALAVDGGRTFH
ncbi:SDR family NAD(P)-dependent oxidoreductase [Paracoccus cavernae]|uniref:SDR family NAD(P)-dependent oxidoreductase n=1 Tax=Paracoccus cavernae TaxID=1571207 RepID=UPI0035F36AFB